MTDFIGSSTGYFHPYTHPFPSTSFFYLCNFSYKWTDKGKPFVFLVSMKNHLFIFYRKYFTSKQMKLECARMSTKLTSYCSYIVIYLFFSSLVRVKYVIFSRIKWRSYPSQILQTQLTKKRKRGTLPRELHKSPLRRHWTTKEIFN